MAVDADERISSQICAKNYSSYVQGESPMGEESEIQDKTNVILQLFLYIGITGLPGGLLK